MPENKCRSHSPASCVLAEPGWAQPAALVGVTCLSSSPGVSGLPRTLALCRRCQGARRQVGTRKASWSVGSEPSQSHSCLVLLTQASLGTKPYIRGWGLHSIPLTGETAGPLGESGNAGRGKEPGQHWVLQQCLLLVKNTSTHSLILLSKGGAFERGLGCLAPCKEQNQVEAATS